ncbi:hypothetical protein [Listeria aquatica]|uniref:DUF8208 domain-containing protein n=1 Tax=Listeria aquatica FSL S10-1188 TaxID=1265818 RepID=W7B1L9_9LIST|nr:hypothetical protein [Listeria aquatica]EUJ16591.1 hypothetical protein MAQA_15681 [Listeria aquatica FSL S10-1188]
MFIFSTLIVVQTSFELGIKGTIGPFITATDISTGQRIKNLLVDIIGAYVKIVVLVFMIQLYRVFMTWTQTLDFSSSLTENLVIKCLICVGAFFAVLQGSGSVQRLLGIDVSQGFGQQALMGTLAGGKILGGMSEFAKNSTKSGIHQFGKDGFARRGLQKLGDRKEEKAKKAQLQDTLGGKESYNHYMSREEKGKRDGFNEGQQILATNQAMRNDTSTDQENTPENTDSNPNPTNSSGSSGSGAHSDTLNNQSGEGPKNSEQESTKNQSTNLTKSEKQNASTDSLAANGSGQTGETPKTRSNAVDRLNKQRNPLNHSGQQTGTKTPDIKSKPIRNRPGMNYQPLQEVEEEKETEMYSTQRQNPSHPKKNSQQTSSK